MAELGLVGIGDCVRYVHRDFAQSVDGNSIYEVNCCEYDCELTKIVCPLGLFKIPYHFLHHSHPIAPNTPLTVTVYLSRAVH